jgi:chorismate--pyruvate lyase
VLVLKQQWRTASFDEQKKLSLQNQEVVWVRTIKMLVNHNVWIYAWSVFPESTLTDEGKNFTELGTTPLGDILFNQFDIQRSEFELARLLPQHNEYQEAKASDPTLANYLWARRSVFQFSGKSLLLNEIFMPIALEKLR